MDRLIFLCIFRYIKNKRNQNNIKTMNVKEKYQIIILPTKKAENVLFMNTNGRGNLCLPTQGYYTQAYLKEIQFEAQHLYILSDDEIKEGDWYLVNQYGNGLILATKPASFEDIKYQHEFECKKIIVTTDTLTSRELKEDNEEGIFGGYYYLENNKPIYITKEDFNNKFRLPQPSPLFVQEFIEEWNKGNKIEFVNIDFEEESIPICSSNICETIKTFKSTKLKVDKDNFATITKIKDSWTRDEVIELCKKAFIDGYFTIGKTENMEDNWINKIL